MSHAPSNNHTLCNSHAIANTECTGVFWQQIREMQPYHNAPNYISCRGDYHLFLRRGDKVYIEVRNAGEIVISYAKLQKNELPQDLQIFSDWLDKPNNQDLLNAWGED